ncbi:unnamed protein product [Lactuca saligna]|uniref:MULE transposase domain-containing protein n=1 Tax=Lactuca saligna TaxID=75948 RepID=A0AA35ZWF5_LACSI|nr:unnamed protein product [Lactuca saligna]
MSVRDVDFGGMDYREFVLWVSKLTRRSCENLYYCSTHERLAEGIRRIDNDADYFEFIEDGYMDKQELSMNVYIDNENEPILDWADKELLTGDKLSDVIEDDDTESQISDIRECEHEPDEEVHTFDKTYDDEFLNKLCGKPILNSNQEEVNDADDDEDRNKDDEVVFPVFDEKQEWDKMVPVLGMKFANPLELKLYVTNYAVKNGGQLLAAIGRDANNHIYPVAWAVVEVENKESWKWFLDLLIDDIGMGVGHGLTIISD